MRLYPTAAAALTGLTLGLFLPSAVGDPPNPTVATPAPAAPAVEVKPMAMKVFTLNRATTDDVRSAWDTLLGDQNEFAPLPMPEEGKKKKKNKLPAAGGTGVFGNLGGQFGLCGFDGGAIGFAGGGTPVWRATADVRTRQVVVRGSDRVVKAAGEIVAVLDRAEKAPLPKLEVIRAHVLKHATADDLAQSLSELEIDGLKLHPSPGLLLYAGKEADLTAVADVVKALDVAERPGAEK